MASIGVVQSATGSITVKTADGEIKQLKPGDVLQEGDQIQSSDGQVNIQLANGQMLTVLPGQSMAMNAGLLTKKSEQDVVVEAGDAESALVDALLAGEDPSQITAAPAAGERASQEPASDPLPDKSNTVEENIVERESPVSLSADDESVEESVAGILSDIDETRAVAEAQALRSEPRVVTPAAAPVAPALAINPVAEAPEVPKAAEAPKAPEAPEAPAIEHSPAQALTEQGVVAGDIVANFAAVSQGSDVLEYRLTHGNEKGYFAIVPETGSVSLTQVGVEAINADEGTDLTAWELGVTATDGKNFSEQAVFSIDINRVNDNAPTIDSFTGSLITENEVAVGDIVATFTATDLDDLSEINFQLSKGNDNGYFSISESTGDVTLTQAGVNAINSDDGTDITQFILGVTATDGALNSSEAEVIIDVTRRNDNAPVIDTADGHQIVEGAVSQGMVVASFVATDLDDNDQLSYTITSGNDLGLVAINPTTGKVALTQAGVNFINDNSRSVTELTIGVTASDGSASTNEMTATIDIIPANNAGVISGDDRGAVEEDTSVNTTGTLKATNVADGQPAFISETTAGNYGSITIDAHGSWRYDSNNNHVSIQSLSEGDELIDAVTVRTLDGKEHYVVITISGTNDAPVISLHDAPTLKTIAEDDSNPNGETVISLFGSLISDGDADSLQGIAITGADTANGAWQYSSDGGSTWQAVGNVSEASARLLDASDQLRFVPDANYHGTETLSLRAWDQTTGTVGTLADTRANGGATAFSSGIEEATLTISPGNDAPVLDTSGTPTLTAVGEDDANNAGQTVSDLFGSLISDIDSGSVKGIAITGTDNTHGNWQYSSDNGASWQSVNAVTDSNALLLDGADKVRFLPDANYNGSATFDFRAWDQSTGTAGALADTTANGGITAFSTLTETASITINPVNDAPVLEISGSPTLTTISEDDPDPAGETVGSLFGSLISDTDAGSMKGIAITGADTTNGAWQYSADGGSSWQPVGNVSEASARLLDASDQLRFVPDANYHGSETLSLRAWDKSAGTAGTLADTTNNGGVTAFSSAIEAATLTISATNDAPVLDTSGAPTLMAMNEGDANNAGQTVSDLFGSLISDIDSGSVKGIAITGTDNSHGNWQYSNDNGASWQSISAVTQSNALLLDGSDKVRFLPDANFNGSATFDFRAWDQSSGTAGTLADTTAHGGMTAFSTLTETASITINPVNDAPVLEISGSPTLASISEDDPEPAGETVGSLFGSLISDTDAGSMKGIAITGADTTNGAWQYSADGGSSWQPVGNVSEASARLLDASDQLRFVPDANYHGTETLSLRAWDKTTGAAGTLVDTSNNGGVTAFSSAMEAATLTISATNDAPVLDTSGTPTLMAVNEGDANNAGQTVSDLFSSLISDVDSGSVKGIAITGTDNTHGNWQYSNDNGASWQPIGAVAQGNALLLDGSDKVRFLPDANFNGSATFDFRAWDQTAGTAGTQADTTANGGMTAFSALTETASITINPVNDAPVLEISGSPTLTTISEDDPEPAGETVGSLFGSLISDTDAGSMKGIAITGADTANGAWQYSADGGSSWQPVGNVSETSARLLDASDQLRFVPDANYHGSETLSLRAWDQSAGTAGTLADTSNHGGATAFSSAMEAATLTISATNDAPVLDTSGTPTLTTMSEDDASSAGQTVSDLFGSLISDIDSGSVKGIAITTADNTHGNWQYSNDNGASWQSINAVTDSNALLLDGADKVRFLPDANFNGSATFDFRAWDQTAGTAGTQVDTTANGGLTAFSALTETASITINPVNDAPVLEISGSPTLTTMSENDPDPAGETVSTLFGNLISDTDAGSMKGIAITGADTANGAWQYSSDGGTTWQPVGNVSETSARLLDASDQLRFVPDADYHGTETLSLRAWDKTTGTAGTLADTSNNGGVTAFSSAIEEATLTISSTNSAPVSQDSVQNIEADQSYQLSADDFSIQDADSDDTHTITLTAINGDGILLRGPQPELMLDFEDAGALGADQAGVSVATLHGAQAASDPDRGGIVEFGLSDAITLDQPLSMGDSWTISTGFKGLINDGNWKVLSASDEGYQVMVSDSGELGSWNTSTGFHSSGFNLSSHPAVADGEWVNLVVVGENDKTTFYVDGQSVGSVDLQPGGSLTTVGNMAEWGINMRFAESLADFKVFDQALTPEQFGGGNEVSPGDSFTPEALSDLVFVPDPSVKAASVTTIDYRVTDNEGADSGTHTLTINVAETNEAPVFELTPDPSLVTVLNFAEGDGSTSGDLTGQGHDASLGNGAQWTNEGVNLNGTGGNLGDLQFGGDFTLATTFTYNSHHGWARIVDLGNGSASDNIVIGSPSLGRIEAHVFRGNSTKVVGFDNFYTVGETFHVALSVDDNGHMRLYKNGVEVADNPNGHVPNDLARTNTYIGKSNWGEADTDGTINDLVILDRSLDGSEVNNLYTLSQSDQIDGLLYELDTASDAETLVNTTTGADQNQSGIAAHPDGGYISTWMSNDSGEEVVMAQRFDASGNPVGAEHSVNISSAGGSTIFKDPSVTILPSGDYAVAWQHVVPGSYASSRISFFQADGTAVANSSDNVSSSDYGITVTALADGRYALSAINSNDNQVKVRLFNADGSDAGTVDVAAVASWQWTQPDVAALDNGGFAVTWRNNRGNDDSAQLAIFNADGTQAHGPVAFGGNAASSRDHANTQVVVLENGTLVTGYESAGTWYIQRWSASGTAEGAPIAVGSDDVIPGSDLQLTAVGDDVLTTFVAADDDGTGIYSQLYGDDGAVLTDPMLINDTSAGDQSMPAVTALSDGTVKIVWSSDHSGNDDVYSKTLALGHVVGESAEPGTLVGKARATDPEGDALTFSLVDDAGGRFAIDPQTGEITVAGALDYAVAPSHALTVRVTDSSGNVTDQATIIRVAEINHTPDAEDNSLTMQGSSSYSFSADDFHFSDADMADSLRSVTITSLPTIGTLALNGVAVTANQVIAAEDIPNLTFTTPFSQSAGNDQFGFTVSDGAASSAIQTFTLDVQAVNVSGNLLTNASAGSFNSGWSVPSDANAWGFSSNSHDGNSRSWTTSSNTFAKKSQTLDLLAKGFDPDYLDTAPDINISDWFKNNGVSSNQFYMKVEIRDADHNVLASYDSGVLNSGSSWGEESHIFQNYGAGARYIYFEHGGNNIGSSSGNYGTMIDDSEIVVALESGSDMTGTGGSEILVGTANSDTIKGEAGSDKLLGNAGDDLIQGGAGDDTLTGGSGSDTFTWMTADLGSAQSPAEDVITDFQLGQGGDVINLKDVMQNGNHSPEQHLALSFENGNTLLEIKPQANGGVTQRIKLEGVDLSSLGNSDAEIINNLIYQGNLQLEENEAPVFVTQSLSLDGTAGDYAEIGTVNANSARPFPTTATTVEMWLQPDIAGNNVQTPFTYEVGSTDALQVILRPDLGKAVIWIDHAGYVVDVPALFDGGWHHLSFSWDSASGELKIYLDGQLEDTGTHKQGDSIGTGGGLVLGQEADSQMGGYNGSQAFAGKMRDFRIWNDVRDQAEIEANMDSGGTLDAEAQGLVSHYLLNGDANDRGPGGNHLTVTGASWVASDDPADNDLYQIIEDAQQGTEVGRAQVTDADGDVLTYSLVDDAGGRFAIDPQTGVITVAGALDYAVASSHSVTVRVTDSLGGYADQVTTINVAQLNQTPDAEDNSLLMQGSGSYSFSVDDFHFSDADMADSLQSVTITTLPSTGALTLNGSAVTANQVIAASDIPNLTYTAPVSASAVSGQFEFTVSDGKASSSVQTITLEVQPSGSGLTGTTESEIIIGTASSDTIKGEEGSDKLLGNAGDDLIYGGAGDDTLTGGSGSDTFAWTAADLGSAQSPAEDVITDFQVGQGGDVIDLSGVMLSNVNSPEQHIALSFENGNTILEIKPQANGDVTQRIKLEGVDLSSLGNTDADIINNLLGTRNLQLEENEAPVFELTPDSSLVTVLNFAEGDGSSSGDLTGQGHDASLGNGAQWTNEGVNLNGTGGNLGDLQFGGDFTLATTFTYNSHHGWARIVDLGNGSASDNIVIGSPSLGRIEAHVFRGNSTKVVGFDNFYTVGETFHVALSVDDNGHMRLYKNGVEVADNPNGHVPNDLARTNTYIGKSNWGEADTDGTINDLVILDRSLDGSEVNNLYTLSQSDQIDGLLYELDTASDAETLVNTTTGADQNQSGIAAHPDGGYISTWMSNDSGEEVVMAQRFDASGNPVGAEHSVNISSAGGSTIFKDPSVTILPSGDYAVAWQHVVPGSYASSRISFFQADGTAVANSSDNVSSSDYGITVTALADGRYALSAINSNDNQVKVRLFNADGSDAGTVDVAAVASWQWTQPDVAALDNGGFAVTWRNNRGNDDSAQLAIFNADGTQAHGPVAFGGNAASSRDHANTQVVVLENGTLVTGYESAGTWYIQRWSASGTAEGAPIAVGSDDVIPGSDLQLTAVGDDVLTTFVAADDDGTGIYSQLYGDDGAVLTDPMLINDTSAGDQSMPAVTALSDGTVKIVWSSDHSGNDDVYSKTLALGHEVVENAKVGTLVGKVQATDAEGEALTYSLVDDAGGRFAIDPLTGVITVARAVDYEAAASHALIVRAADALGESTEQTIVVHIENVNEAPVSEDGAQSVGAGQPYALSVDDFNIQDPDNDDTHTITLTGINGEGSLFRGPLPELMLDFEDAGALGADLAGVSVATLHGTQAASDPNRGGIVNFDSQGDVIALDQPLALGNSWTISTGFKGLGSGNWKSLSRSSEGFQVIVNSNGELGSYVGGSFYSSGFDLSSHPAVTAGEWVDLVAVGENGQTTFYVNGQSVGSVNQQVGGNLSLIGNNGVNGSERFAENLADFRLFDRALEPSEFDGGTKINLFREPQPELMLDFEDAGAMGANQAGVSVATLHGTQSASDPDRGGVVEFDNQGDAITLDQPLALGNSWTISTAFKGLGSGTWKSLSRGSDGFQVIVNNDGMLGSYANGTFHSSGFDLSSHPAVTAGDWVDLVAVGENGQTTFYVDGQFVGSVSQQIGGNLSTIGNNAANGSERFAENLADFRVFDQALVPSEFYGTKFDLFREPEPELMLDFEDAGAMGANQAGVSVATLHGTQSASDPDRGGVVEFDNQGDAITLDQPLALGNSWTISTAFKGLGSSGILSRSSDGFQVVVNNDGELGSFVGGSFYSSGFDLSSHPAVTAGDWVDLVAVGENGQTTFYVNGQSVGSVSQQVGGNLSTIGNSAANGSERFAESLADFKVFDRALAPGEISSRNEMSLEESFTAEEVAELVFVPNENANSGANSIEYQVTDGQGVKTSSHTLSINVAEQISGTANDDQLQGTSGIDELIGLDGNDELTGGAGNDLLIGGAGDDILIGGDGQDEYIWHLGDDVTADPNVMAVDRIRDFQTGVGGDVLNIKDLLVDESEHNIGDYLELNFKDGNTEIDVKPTGSGASTQKIILDDVDLSSLGSEADVLNKLLNDGNLNIDH